MGDLARLLHAAAAAPDRLRAGRTERAREANRLFGYEQQAKRLVALVETALERKRR